MAINREDLRRSNTAQSGYPNSPHQYLLVIRRGNPTAFEAIHHMLLTCSLVNWLSLVAPRWPRSHMGCTYIPEVDAYIHIDELCVYVLAGMARITMGCPSARSRAQTPLPLASGEVGRNLEGSLKGETAQWGWRPDPTSSLLYSKLEPTAVARPASWAPPQKGKKRRSLPVL